MRIVNDLSGWAEDTITILCTDLVQAFTAVQLLNAAGSLPIECLITVEGQNQTGVRFAYYTNPTQGADGSGAIGHVLYLGQSFMINTPRNIAAFRFINHTNGNDAYIQVSMHYDIGD